MRTCMRGEELVLQIPQFFDPLNRLSHLQPLPHILLAATKPNLQQLRHLPFADPPHGLVKDITRLGLRRDRSDPASQVRVFAIPTAIAIVTATATVRLIPTGLQEPGGELAGEGLEDEDAEAPDVGLLRDAAEVVVLWGFVSDEEVVGVILVGDGDEGVVGEKGFEGVGEEDVGGLEVAMRGHQAGQLLVEVGQPPGYPFHYLQPGRPV